MDHSISIVVERELALSDIRLWFQCVKEHAPKGVVATVSVDGKPVQIVKSKGEDVRYAVPLTRDLNDGEVKTIIDAMSGETTKDFKVAATSNPLNVQIASDIIVDHDPMIELCTQWAKKKHEDWMSTRSGDGWRYGPTVSKSNKTHPLMRDWAELPAEYREVDHQPAQDLLDLLRRSGYVLIRHDDLDRLLGGDL
jgi:hypothetical protein